MRSMGMSSAGGGGGGGVIVEGRDYRPLRSPISKIQRISSGRYFKGQDLRLFMHPKCHLVLVIESSKHCAWAVKAAD